MIRRSFRIDVGIDYKNDENLKSLMRFVSARCGASWLQKPKNEKKKEQSGDQNVADVSQCVVNSLKRESLAVFAMISARQFH